VRSYDQMSDAVRVVVTGDRRWECPALARRVVERLKARYGAALVVVHGAAGGVDHTFDTVCLELRVRREPHPANWRWHGDRAGPIRNQEMIDAGAAFVVAVHRDLAGSRGTRDCVRRALQAGVPVYVLDHDDAEPRRITEA
jgi:hypothetical protein